MVTSHKAIVASTPVAPSSTSLTPLGIDEVTITSGYWARRQEINGTVSIGHCDHWEERVGWIDNFRRAAEGTLVGRRTGREFSDSDVYKMIEGMAWEVGRSGDERLDARIHELAAIIARVQEPDGYLNTRFGRVGQEPRYSDLAWGHELYNYGHLLQAAVARLRTGHDDELVAIARRAADHVCDVFGPGGIESVCGHAVIEPALVEFYRATGEGRYLEQARLFIERRGHQTLPDIEFGRAYFQDDQPIRAADVFRGHAVRALYLASGAIDVAVETGDDELLAAVDRQFRRTLARRTYITGGMGSHHQDEAFGEDFELPPDRAYCESCAGVGAVMVAWRMMLATGELGWGDVIERSLFNVIATSPAEDGRSFFYTNPLHKRTPGRVADADEVSARALSSLRAPWFEVSCCPTNVARTVAQLATYLATRSGDAVQLHQYASCAIDTQLASGRLRLEVETAYPADGRITVRVVECPDSDWALELRIPDWATGAMLDGSPAAPGVGRVERRLQAGDEVRLVLPVAARISVPDGRIDAVRGCIAVEHGPLVLCAESVDVDAGSLDELRVLPATLRGSDSGVLGGSHPLAWIRSRLISHEDRAWPYGEAEADHKPGEVDIPLVPYHSWANRGPSTMRVWLPTE